MKTGVLAFARPTFDVPFAQEKADAAWARLQQTFPDLSGGPELLFDADAAKDAFAKVQDADALIILQVTFSDASMVLELARAWNKPLGIWAFGEPRTGGRLRLNSFCGLNLASHALHRASLPHAALVAEADGVSDDALKALTSGTCLPVVDGPVLPAPAASAPSLLNVSVGQFGAPPDGFETCRVDHDELTDRFGAKVERAPVQTIFEAAKLVDAGRVETLHAETSAQLAGIGDMEAEPLDKALRSFAALRDATDEKGYDALAVRCWPETFTEYGCAVCGAMARMGEEGVPAGCESDVPGTLTSLLMQKIADDRALLVDIVDFDAGSAVVWHCGLAPLSFADSESTPEATIHSNRKKPLLQQFPLKPGQVTLARIGQFADGWRLILGVAEMVRAPLAFSGTAGTLHFSEDAAVVRDRMLAIGLEHHVSVAYGDIRPQLLAFAQAHDLPVVSLC